MVHNYKSVILDIAYMALAEDIPALRKSLFEKEREINETGKKRKYKTMYEFSSKGFFGYGDEDDFRYFSIPHFIPLLLLILAIIITYLNRDLIREWEHEETSRYVYAFIMMIVEMSYFWRLLYVGDETGQNSLMIKLPLQVCQWSLIAAIFMVLSKNQILFDFCFYNSLVFGLAACLTPTVIVRTGPGYYRYYQFFLEHELPIYAVFYMAFVHGLRPKYEDLYLTIFVLILFALLCIYVNNRVPKANFMYLAGFKEEAVAGDNPINHLPKGQYTRMALLTLITIILFNILYFLWTFTIGRII